MKLMINHQTHYQYTEQAKNSVQYIKMTPQNNAHQRVHTWAVSAPGEVHQQVDGFDNIWLTTSQRYAYQNLTIMAQGIVEINPLSYRAINNGLNPSLFLQWTQSTLCDAAMQAFAHRYVPQLNHANLMRLSAALLDYMPYLPATTQVNTDAIDAFQHRQGVCQDHSHVFIAMCRCLGLPARYVSGYLFVPDQSHLASHAWVEVYLDGCWHTFDISNQLYTPSSHIYVAIGRDYWDVAPIRGVRQQGGIERMTSVVQVLPC